MWPQGWLEVAAFRKECGLERQSVEYALRRAVEEIPFSKEAWLIRARYAQSVSDDATVIACFVSAVEIDPSNVELLREAALHLGKYLTDHASEIPTARRGSYLASVRAHMERVADSLDATGLSRLAWLFLLEGDGENGRQYARLGLSKDPHNQYCRKILEKEEVPKREYKKVARRR
jgi:Tfp pilus assembly protein PilF